MTRTRAVLRWLRRRLNRALAGLPDEAIDRRFRGRVKLQLVFAAIARAIDPAEHPAIRGEVHCHLDGSGGQDAWTLVIGERRARAHQGCEGSPLVAIRTTRAHFMRLVAGLDSPLAPQRDTPIRVDGPLLVASRIFAMFDTLAVEPGDRQP